MAGRGRGRGRGRGSQMSFDCSQLGFGVGDALLASSFLQPPPVFPSLEHKPIPLKSGPESKNRKIEKIFRENIVISYQELSGNFIDFADEYMVALKRDFVEYFHSFSQNNNSLSAIERFSDKYQVMISDVKESWDSRIDWDAMPTELNPKRKKALKRKSEKPRSSDIKKAAIDISSRLDELAKLEDKEEDESEGVKESEEKNADEENDKENIEEEEDEDEEMDDGTDYVNNYFDNGESYFDDEDDNLDDGAIY